MVNWKKYTPFRKGIPSWRFRVSVSKNFLKGFAYFSLCIGLFCLYGWIYLDVLGLETPKHSRLRKEYAELHSRVDLLRHRIEAAEISLDQLNLRDNDVYRSIFGMEPVSEDVRRGGYGGTDRFDYMASSDFSGLLTSTARYLNTVNKMAYVQSKSLDDIKHLSGRLGDMAFCVPSIYPVYKEKVRFASRFGYRVDPVSRSFSRMHEGVDLSGKRGLPIFATGSGVVKEAGRIHSGYGNTILVDHGFGYMTRYAHLDMILVGKGQKVSRGEQIGTLGNTGRSIGDHLHYEVIYRGRHVNPLTYMNEEISKEDYAAMVTEKEVPKPQKRQGNGRRRSR